MAGQEHRRDRREDDEPEGATDAPEVAETARQRDEEVDALLEEIDDVLETNAEQFVRGFVQKGGQ